MPAPGSPNHAKMPPYSFLVRNTRTVDDLLTEIRKNPKVARRYAEVYHVSPARIVAVMRSELILTRTKSARSYWVFCVDNQGHLFRLREVIPAGARVFALRNGTPFLKLDCGNPLTATLPAIRRRLAAERPSHRRKRIAKRPGIRKPVTAKVPTPRKPIAGKPGPEISTVSPSENVEIGTPSESREIVTPNEETRTITPNEERRRVRRRIVVRRRHSSVSPLPFILAAPLAFWHGGGGSSSESTAAPPPVAVPEPPGSAVFVTAAILLGAFVRRLKRRSETRPNGP
jgi:hypothetical protein